MRTRWARSTGLLAKRVFLVILVFPVTLVACQGPAPAPPPGDPTWVTAKDAYRTAVGIAVGWRSDARLINVTASWHAPQPEVLGTGRTTWAFYFASPSANPGYTATYVVTVAEGRAEGLKESEIPGTFRALTYLDWKVDSPKALDAFLVNGGLEFLRRHENADVQARLYVPREGSNPTWLIAGLDREQRAAKEVRIDATTGTIGAGTA